MKPDVVTFVFVFSLLYVSACSQEAVTQPAIPITETSAVLPQLSTIPATSENSPALEAGQWTYIFYHEGLKQVLLVNGEPEQGKPADEPLELWGWNGMQWSL